MDKKLETVYEEEVRKSRNVKMPSNRRNKQNSRRQIDDALEEYYSNEEDE